MLDTIVTEQPWQSYFTGLPNGSLLDYLLQLLITSGLWSTYCPAWITDCFVSVYTRSLWSTSAARTVVKVATKALRITLASAFMRFHLICSSSWDGTEPTTKKIFPHKVFQNVFTALSAEWFRRRSPRHEQKVTVARSVRCRSNNVWMTELCRQCFQRLTSICRHRLQFHDPRPRLRLWARVEQKLSRWKHWTSRSGS